MKIGAVDITVKDSSAGPLLRVAFPLQRKALEVPASPDELRELALYLSDRAAEAQQEK